MYINICGWPTKVKYMFGTLCNTNSVSNAHYIKQRHGVEGCVANQITFLQ